MIPSYYQRVSSELKRKLCKYWHNGREFEGVSHVCKFKHKEKKNNCERN